MLVLVWSQDKTVRDAVAVAYKKLYLNTESSTPRYMYNLNLCAARFVCIVVFSPEWNELCKVVFSCLLFLSLHEESPAYLDSLSLKLICDLFFQDILKYCHL
jgi:hypothetical protein